MVTRRGLIVGDLTIEPWVVSEKFMIATVDGEEQYKPTGAPEAENQ